MTRQASWAGLMADQVPARYHQLVAVTTTFSQAKLCLGAIIAVGARQNPPSPQSQQKCRRHAITTRCVQVLSPHSTEK